MLILQSSCVEKKKNADSLHMSSVRVLFQWLTIYGRLIKITETAVSEEVFFIYIHIQYICINIKLEKEN